MEILLEAKEDENGDRDESKPSKTIFLYCDFQTAKNYHDYYEDETDYIADYLQEHAKHTLDPEYQIEGTWGRQLVSRTQIENDKEIILVALRK